MPQLISSSFYQVTYNFLLLIIIIYLLSKHILQTRLKILTQKTFYKQEKIHIQYMAYINKSFLNLSSLKIIKIFPFLLVFVY